MSSPATFTDAAEQTAPRQARAVERRETLLRAAARVFAQRGYASAQMDEIARAAETSKGGLYFHFATKEALLAAVVGQAAGLLRRRVTRAMDEAGADPVSRAEAALAALFDSLAEHRSLARVLAAESLAGRAAVQERTAAVEDEFASLVAAELRRAQADGRIAPLDPDLTALAWVAMVRGVIAAWAAGRVAAPLHQLYPQLRDLLLRSAGVDPTDHPAEHPTDSGPD